MNILCIGDIVGRPGRQAVQDLLPLIKDEYAIDFVIANAENAAAGAGLIPQAAKELFSFGCDVLTMGDHVWDKKEITSFLVEEPRLLRPANFPVQAPGQGFYVASTAQGVKIAVINLLGRVFIRYNVNCPFEAAQRLLLDLQGQAQIILIDFHGEATSEKIAFGHFVNGKASAVFGTHTHVQTADEQILSCGTGYLTDAGMTGPFDSVIGQNKENIVQRFLTSMPTKFQVAEDDIRLSGVIFTIDEASGKTMHVTRIQRRLR